MGDYSLAGIPTGAVLAGAAYGDPAAGSSALAPPGASLATSASMEEWEDEEPNRCAATRDQGRCKNNRRDGESYCGIHLKFYKALDSLEIPE